MSTNAFRLSSSINNCYTCRYDSLDIFKYEFSINGDTNGWGLSNNVYMFGAWNNSLFGYAADRSCYIARTENFLPVVAENYHMLRITMKIINNNTDTFKGQSSLKTGRIKWISLEETVWDDLKFQDFDLYTDGIRHTYTIDLGPNGAWVGNIIGLRIYPFIDGWKGDSFYISSIRLGSDTTFSCTNSACTYNPQYSHPCKGAGSTGTITSIPNNSANDTFTTISGISDALSINIDGYGYEVFNLGNNIAINGFEFAKVINRTITALGVGSYAYAVVEYTTDKRLKISSGSIGSGGSVYIKDNALARNLGFYNEIGTDVSIHTYGTDCADGFSYLSTRLLTAEELFRLIDGDLSTTSYTHTPNLSSVSAGRSDYYTSIKESTKYRFNSVKYKVSYKNRLKTLIDITHPIDSNGILKSISVAGEITEEDQAKVIILRPLKNGNLKVIAKFDFVNRKDMSFMSEDPMFYKIDFNIYVQKGDVIGFYNISLFYGRGKRTFPDASFYHVSGEVTGTFDPGHLNNYGTAGFLFYCEGSSNQQNIVIDVDFGNRLNIKNIGVHGKLETSKELCNICLCEDVSFTDNYYGSTHRHPIEHGYITHTNKGFGLDALVDGQRTSNNGIVGELHGSDSDGIWTAGKHSYFYVNGDGEFREAQNHPQDFDRDPVELTVLWDYGTPLKISKVAIYFKDSYNFRNMEISYYLGYYDTSGDSTNSEYFKRINYNKVYLDGVLQDKEKNSFIYQNPTSNVPIFEKGVCINGDIIRTAASSRWFLYECEFDPVDSYGLRIFSDYHKSTKIMEIEAYADYGIESSLNNAMYLKSSKDGDLWSDTEFLKVSDGEFIGYVGDSPRYLQFEISSLTQFTLKEITAVLDDNIKTMDCEQTLLLEHAKNKSINKATPITFKNTYDVPLDLEVTIEKNILIPNKMILKNTVSSYEDVSNSVIGAGGFIEKYMDPFELKSYFGNIASGAKIYCLKNLLAGKKYYYKQGDCPWEEKGLIYDNGYTPGVSRGFDWKNNTLEFDTLYGKYFEIGVYSPTYNSEIGVLYAYYMDEVLPIKKVKVGMVDSFGDGRTEVRYDNNLHVLSGETVFKDNFDTGELSSLWEVEHTTISGVTIEDSLYVSEEGLQFKVSWAQYPRMTVTLDKPVKDFELILDIERDLLCEEDIVGDQFYKYNRTAMFKIQIELIDINNEVVGTIIPLERVPDYTHDDEDSVNITATYINGIKMDSISNGTFPKSKLNIKRINNTFYVYSDLTGAFSYNFDQRDITFKNEYIHKIKIYFGRSVSGLLDTGNYLYYGDKELFDNRVYTPSESATRQEYAPPGYLKYILKSIEIKSVPSLSIYKRMYLEFENNVYLNKLDIYAGSFRLGRPIYVNEPDMVAIIGIGKSNDGMVYNIIASTKNEMDTYCYNDGNLVKGQTGNYQENSAKYVFDGYVPTQTYPSSETEPIGGYYNRYIKAAYEYLKTCTGFAKWDEYNGAYLTYDFGEYNHQVFDKIEILFNSSYNPGYITPIEKIQFLGSNDYENWTSLYMVDEVELHPNFDDHYVIDIEGDQTMVYRRLVLDDLPQVPYRYIKLLQHSLDKDYLIHNIEFKLKMSENNIQLSYNNYIDFVAVDLEQQHSIGWVRHFNMSDGRERKYNYLHEFKDPITKLYVNSDQVEYSSTETGDPEEVVWGSNHSLEDLFLDGIYEDNWEITSISGGMVHEGFGFLEVYSYGDYSTTWHGVTITHGFDKAEYIDIIIDLKILSTGNCKGRTSIVFKDVVDNESFKLVIENIDSNIIEYLYDGGELVYSNSGTLISSDKNTIRLTREIMPNRLKYYVDNTVLYFEDSISTNKVDRLDIIFEKYELYTEPVIHNISYVSLTTVAALSYARWIRFVLPNTDVQIVGNDIKYLSVYPDITKVSTPDGKVNCEWEQFPYSLTTKEKKPDLAKFKAVTTNYPQLLDYSVENVVNGDISGNDGVWAFDILDNGDYPYIEIDLGKEYNINEILLHHGRYFDDTEYVNANLFTENNEEVYTNNGTIELRHTGLPRTSYGYLIDTDSLYYYGCSTFDGGWAYPNLQYTDKMHVKLKVYVENTSTIPSINVVLYESNSVKKESGSQITVAASKLHIELDSINEEGWANASCTLEFNTNYISASAIEFICSNYTEFSRWGVSINIDFYSYLVGLNTCSPLPNIPRDSGYIIEATTTVSGADFEYLHPIEHKTVVGAVLGEDYSWPSYQGALKPCYKIVYGGSRHDRSHYYESMPVRRIRITFKKWDGQRLVYANELTGESEVFTGSFLRSIEVYEEVDPERLENVPTPINLRLPYSIEPVIKKVNTFNSPIIACDLNYQYNIKNFDFAPEKISRHGDSLRMWQLNLTDIRYSDSMSTDPSQVMFSAYDQKQEVFYSPINTDILLFSQNDGDKFITEVELGSNVYLDAGYYTLNFEAYNVSSTSKMSLLFSGNEDVECFMTTVASGTDWEFFEENIEIKDSSYYTIFAEKNQLYEESWGIKYLRISVVQGLGKKWVAFIHKGALDYNYVADKDVFKNDIPVGRSLSEIYNLEYFEAYSIDGNPPTSNSIWWKSEFSELVDEHLNLMEGKSGIRIEYPASTSVDNIKFESNDYFYEDDCWDIDNVLTFWFFISEITSFDKNGSYIVFGNKEEKTMVHLINNRYVREQTTGPVRYYVWNLSNYELVSGWNKVQLRFSEYDAVYPYSVFDKYTINKKISKLLDFKGYNTSSFDLYIKGVGVPFYMILDTIKYERLDFIDMDNTKGLLLLDKESLRFNLSNLSLKYGTIEFDIKLTSNSKGANIFGDVDSKTLFSLLTNANEMMSLIISAAKGFNICVGTVNRDMISTDYYYGSNNPAFFIERNETVRLKAVWSHDGTGMDNANTFRLYVNDEIMFSIDNKWAITSNFVSSIIFGGVTTAMAEPDTKGSGTFFNIKVYNYCKIDSVENEKVKFPNDFLEISKDNSNFYKSSSNELPLKFKGVDPGKEVTLYVRTDKTSGFKDVTSKNGDIMLNWVLVV